MQRVCLIVFPSCAFKDLSPPGFYDWLQEEPLKSRSFGGEDLSRIGSKAEEDQDWEGGLAASFKKKSNDLSWFGAKVNVQCSAAAGSTWLVSIGNTRINSGREEFIIDEEFQWKTGWQHISMQKVVKWRLCVNTDIVVGWLKSVLLHRLPSLEAK